MPSELSLTTLLDLESQIRRMIAEGGGTEAVMEMLDTVQADKRSKIDAISWFLTKGSVSEIEALKAFVEEARQRITSLEKGREGLQQSLIARYEMGMISDDDLQGNRSILSVRNNPQPRVDLNEADDPATWGREFSNLYEVRTEYKPLKKAIAQAYKEGKEIPPGVKVLPPGKHLRSTIKAKALPSE